MTKLIYERSKPGRRASSLPRYDLPQADVPAELARAAPPRLPEVSEPELVRHFTELSTRNFGIDTGFYPLGSCTMKHNPRVNERVVGLPGFRDLHPLQEEESAQGALELMWRLQEILAEVCGLHAVSLQPAAGSQGELTGLMLIRAYFADRGEVDRREIVVPDTAHGTNPASVTMAGFQLVGVKTDGCSGQRTLVVPGDASSSYLMQKLLGTDLCSGSQMPKAGQSLASPALAAISTWICQGAPNN